MKYDFLSPITADNISQMTADAPVFGQNSYDLWKAWAVQEYAIEKSMVTGDGIVQVGDTGARDLRTQFLWDRLETVSFDNEDAAIFHRIPKENVLSNVIEWTQRNLYGGPGNGFVGESGFDSSFGNAFGLNVTDDQFTRLAKSVRYMIAGRTVSLPAQHVRNIADPVRVAREDMELELVGKANLSCYNASNKVNILEFDGLFQQLEDWLTPNSYASGYAGHPEDQVIEWDAQGKPISKEMFEEIKAQNRKLFGRGSLFLSSVESIADLTKSLFPEQRESENYRGAIGASPNVYKSRWGSVELLEDVMLRRNLPLVADGPYISGLPITTSGGMTGGVVSVANPSADPLATATISPSTGYFWQNRSFNTGNPAAAPALPAGAGNQANNLGAGTYYYAVSLVVNGVESQVWVHGEASAGVATGSATAASPTLGQIVRLTITHSNFTIPSGYTYQNCKFRIYRTIKSSATAPTTIGDADGSAWGGWGLLMEVGMTSGSTSVSYDNGMYIPGTDNGLLITERRGKNKEWYWGQLLPLIQRELPQFAMGTPYCLLMFGCPVLPSPRFHMRVRNIGRY